MNKDIIKQAMQELGIDELTPLQQKTINLTIDKRDLIVLSPTGSGKTLAYLLPLLLNLKENKPKKISTLILVPSRELAQQVNRVFSSLKSGFNSVCAYGGHSIQEEKNSLLTGSPHVLVGTPGRILDHMNRGNVDVSDIELLIIDEFDKSLELGFHEDMAEIIHLLPALKRRFLLSATDAKEIPQFTGVGRVARLDFLDEKDELASRIQLMQVHSPGKDKLETLFKLLCTIGAESSIVFCNHRESVDRIHQYLEKNKIASVPFHGGLEQDMRESGLFKFSNGSAYTLIATDLAARGLDIPEVEHVIHYHLPLNEEAFTHRNGRTARWQAEGTSYVILHEEEILPEFIKEEVPTYEFQQSIPAPAESEWVTLYVGKGKKDKVNVIDIVGFMHKTGRLTKGDVGKIMVKDHFSYVAVQRKKVKQLLQLIRNEKIKGMKTIFQEAY